MSLRNRLKLIAKKVFDSLDDLPDFVTYVRSVPGTYDPVTGEMSISDIPYPNVKCVLTRTSEEDIDWFPANLIGQRMIVAALNLPVDPPLEADYVIINGFRWNIHRIRKVPGNSVYIIYIREP